MIATWKFGEGFDIFWESIVNVRLLSPRNTTIIHQFLLPQKDLDIFEKVRDYNDIDL